MQDNHKLPLVEEAARNHDNRRDSRRRCAQSIRISVRGEMMAEGARVMARPADLPDYDNPPVNQVVIGVRLCAG